MANSTIKKSLILSCASLPVSNAYVTGVSNVEPGTTAFLIGKDANGVILAVTGVADANGLVSFATGTGAKWMSGTYPCVGVFTA